MRPFLANLIFQPILHILYPSSHFYFFLFSTEYYLTCYMFYLLIIFIFLSPPLECKPCEGRDVLVCFVHYKTVYNTAYKSVLHIVGVQWVVTEWMSELGCLQRGQGLLIRSWRYFWNQILLDSKLLGSRYDRTHGWSGGTKTVFLLISFLPSLPLPLPSAYASLFSSGLIAFALSLLCNTE